MPIYDACHSATIATDPETCFAALTDVERLPQWQSAVEEAAVLERDDRGRGRVVEFVVNARIRRVRYRLEQLYDEPTRIGSRYLGGDFADMRGEWRFLRVPEGTCAVFDLAIDPGRAVPRPLRRMLSEYVVRGAVRDLADHVGARAAVQARHGTSATG